MAGTVKYYLFNGHGDVVQLTNSSGNVIKTYDYDAFGNEKNPDTTDTNPFRYCGEYFDKETGTYYLRARYYNPLIGRFITEDSYWGKEKDPLSLNLYTYCGNNPVIYIDPSGFVWKDSYGREYSDLYVFIVGKDRIERSNALLRDPSFYNIANWITDGIWSKAEDALFWDPDTETYWQHVLDTVVLASDISGRYATVKLFGSLTDKVGNVIKSSFKGTSNTQLTFDEALKKLDKSGLRPGQTEISKSRVMEIVENYDPMKAQSSVYTDSTGRYLVEGHHTTVANTMLGKGSGVNMNIPTQQMPSATNVYWTKKWYEFWKTQIKVTK